MKANDEQLQVINSNSRTILCLAGAGAGKSFSLVHRIIRLVKDGVDPTSILALTFTNAAAFEMGQKYKNSPDVDLSKPVPEFRTFHSFCYSLIIKDKNIRERLGYSKVPSICDDSKLKEMREFVKQQVGCKVPDEKIDLGVGLTAQEKFKVELFHKALKKKIREENVITFDMLCYNVCELFTGNDPVTDYYKHKYKHILVDEFQDTDPRQFKFVASFPSETSILGVGDALQNVYAFRGTSNKYVKMLSTNPDWEVIRMSTNYRSTRQICEFANAFSKTYAEPEYRIEMKSEREGEPVKVIRGSFTSYDYPVCPTHLDQLVEFLKSSDCQSAVLCRTNKEVNYICTRLTEEGVPYTTSNKSGEAVAMLNSVIDDDYMISWLSTSFLDATHYGDFVRLSSQEYEIDLTWFLARYGSIKQIESRSKKILAIREVLNSDSKASAKFSKITNMLKIKSMCVFDDSVEYTPQDLVTNIRDQIQEQEDTKLYVGTIHSSKGLEYDSVYLMGVDDYMFQLGEEDMNNLYYVGITRAKDHLTIFRK